MRVVLVCLAFGSVLTVCTVGPMPADAVREDAGGVQGGSAPADAGPGAEPVTDAGNAVPDAGTAPDGGAQPGDAGAADAGTHSDAGAAPPDAGRPPDAGTHPVDAGVPDAGIVDLGDTRWTPLFDASLSRFYRWQPSRGRNWDPEGVFRMEGQVLHILGLPATGQAKDFGYLATWEDHHDYRLRLEQRWGTRTFAPRLGKPRDSGLLYHLRGPDRVWPQCIEFQIMEHNLGDTWMLSGTGLTAPVERTGANPPTFDPLGAPESLRGGRLVKSEEPESLTEWNNLELIASGRDSAQVVNGRQVNGATDLEADSGGWRGLSQGRIALQAEGAEVFYRNMELRPLVYLPPPPGAVVLFDGSDLDAWESSGGGAPRWRVADGAMEVVPGEGDLRTRTAFGDVRLHVEFQIPPSGPGAAEQDRGNSGVYLQGRYEVQVLDSFGHALSGKNDCGAIYGVKDADVNEALPPGIWQSYDIVFRAPRWSGEIKESPARITVVWNGSRVQRDVEVWASTVLGDPESPGSAPLRLQDHGHPVRYRNIWLQRL